MPKPKSSLLAMHIYKYAPRHGVMLVLAVGFVALFQDRLSALDLPVIWGGFRAVTLAQWVGALLATAASFWAVGRYDAVVHRLLGTGMAEKTAHRAGIAGIAISQTLGLGVLTGALVRWRMLPDTTLWQATRISGAVAVSFLAGWAVVTGVTLTLFAPNMLEAPFFALLPIIAATALMILSLWGPEFTIFYRQIHWPSIPAILTIIGLAALDTIAAAAALYILLPDVVALPFSSLYPAFLLALGAALVSGTPGGVGPFEITLLALLPDVGAEPVLGAVLGFRAVYYAVPAILGLGILARNVPDIAVPVPDLSMPADAPRLSAAQHKAVKTAMVAEANLLRQGHKMLLSQQGSRAKMVVSKTGQALVSVRDPFARNTGAAALAILATAARNHARVPCHYKCSPRFAAGARRAGYTVMPIAREAWIHPRSFCTDTPKHRQLRRKLRKAKSAGLTTSCPDRLPLQDMASISEGWVARAGYERGFSMGVFTPDYVQTQRCYLAFQKDRLQGFITLNTCQSEWTLDLMRQTGDAPDGIMHALVAHALQDAADLGAPRLSLAAVPFEQGNRFLRKCATFTNDGIGLRQFKSSFDPHWQTLYIAAPNALALCLSAFDIARAIAGKSDQVRRPSSLHSRSL